MNKTNGTNEHLIDWLRDAHAMEMKSIEILEKQERRLNEFPELKERVRQHLEETKQQASRLEGCIAKFDTSRSTAKDIVGKLAGTFAALANSMASDEVVKNVIGDYAVEQFEIACYTSLIEGARCCGEDYVAEICEENLNEEQEMADWLQDHIPTITRQYLETEAAAHSR